MRTQRLHVAVTASQLTALTADGGSAVKATGAFAAPTFILDAASGSVVRADLSTRDLTARLSGGSVANLDGQATKLTLDVQGGSIFGGNGFGSVDDQVFVRTWYRRSTGWSRCRRCTTGRTPRII